MKEKEEKRGGKREGAGRKPKEPTKVLYARVPERLYDQCKTAVGKIIKQ